MRARAYLGKLNKLESLIENKRAEIERWEAVALDCSVHMDGERVPSSGNKQKMANAVDTYLDLRLGLDEAIRAAELERQEIIHTIEQLPANQYNVLFQIYVRGLQLKQVEMDMGRSHTWVCTTHRKALVSLQKIMDQKEKDNAGQSVQEMRST